MRASQGNFPPGAGTPADPFVVENLEVNQDAHVTGDLLVSNDATVVGDVTVTGKLTAAGNVEISQTGSETIDIATAQKIDITGPNAQLYLHGKTGGGNDPAVYLDDEDSVGGILNFGFQRAGVVKGTMFLAADDSLNIQSDAAEDLIFKQGASEIFRMVTAGITLATGKVIKFSDELRPCGLIQAQGQASATFSFTTATWSIVGITNAKVLVPIPLKVGERLKQVDMNMLIPVTANSFATLKVWKISATGGASQLGSTQTAASTGNITLSVAGLTDVCATGQTYYAEFDGSGVGAGTRQLQSVTATVDRV